METAVIVALMLLLFTGVYAVSSFANDQNVATTAVRAGGRYLAQVGNNHFVQGGSGSPTSVDEPAAREVCRVAMTMVDLVGIKSIVVYQPTTNSDGSWASTDPTDTYTVDGSCNVLSVTFANAPSADCVSAAGANTGYPLNCRKQIHPDESQIGVLINYSFNSPTPIMHVVTTGTEYTVVTLAPVYT